MAREFAKQFYKSKEWQRTREYILKRDNYLCIHCGQPAEEVHHIKHIEPSNIGDVSITMNPDNLASLCRACHFAEHRGDHGNGRRAKAEYSYEFDANGMLVKRTDSPLFEQK